MPSSPPNSGRPRIVLVEDDISLLGALKFALEADGFDVRAYTAAQSLLDHPISADCLVVDLKLPDGNGLELIAALRERQVLSPAILITSNPDAHCRRAAAAAGVPIVEKPLITGELRRRIDEAIASHA
ncbi:MAG: response regulator [Caulobacterales bacterium]